MRKRYLYLWFRFLAADRLAKADPNLKGRPFLFYAPERGRMEVRAVSPALIKEGITPGMVVADVRAIFPEVDVFLDDPEADREILDRAAEWCLRYSPEVAVDYPDGVMLQIAGCPHLWGGELAYLESITASLNRGGYRVAVGIADTVGAAWAIAHYGGSQRIIGDGKQGEALLELPPEALRVERATLQLMAKLGFHTIGQLLKIPRASLRRRFGTNFLLRLGQALGTEREVFKPIEPVPVFLERLPCMEPIRTAKGIEIALKRLLDLLCERLVREGKGMRMGVFKGYRLDGEVVQISIGTSRASRNTMHLYKLFVLKIPELEPALGIELFSLEATLVEELDEWQETFWGVGSSDQKKLAELLDNLAGKLGKESISRYLPQEHHWPENSVKITRKLEEQSKTEWRTDHLRPLNLLPNPEPIEVMVTLPDYPPLHFRYRGEIIRVVRADGPERIEQEWWLQTGPSRDYFRVEDERGVRYWLFRLGIYGKEKTKWFLHGYFI
ncbi:Y-family DNA polymerase [Sunxiuqinia elliptica]|uniref:Protein ImuB n=1 Tax=Sunxiuqinia elliptica TaxID=655355 RepID=A0A4R6GL23_9BACT|nr:DNA polymerase Y family protein [Sunxiuqinia elliptica]TDN95839.1 protein ImuB [Sunxiuqinia elliptica]TDO67781.1 protein ImuB [Sunxiuqinia elliptica]